MSTLREVWFKYTLNIYSLNVLLSIFWIKQSKLQEVNFNYILNVYFKYHTARILNGTLINANVGHLTLFSFSLINIVCKVS